jgi:hypothetical protein
MKMNRGVNTLQEKTCDTYYIHGARILLRGHPELTECVSEYFRPLHQGDVSSDAKPLKLEVHLVEEPPQLPSDAVKVIERSRTLCYICAEKVLLVSRDGTSMFLVDPVKGEVKGFVYKELDPLVFIPLLGLTVVETLKYRGLYFLHGACVGNGRAYLFLGRSRAGKSSAAFNLVMQGFQFVGDDSLLLSEHNGDIVVSPYYMKFHVDQILVNRCPEIKVIKKIEESNRGSTRMQVDMVKNYPDSFIPSLTPKRIIFPKISSSVESSFCPLNQMEVYGRLLKQTSLPPDKAILQNQLKALGKLVKQAKGFELVMAKDVLDDPKILPVLLDGMS